MSKDTPARLIQDKVSQRTVAGYGVPLIPERVSRWRRDAAYDDVTNLSAGMSTDNMDVPGAAHHSVSKDLIQKELGLWLAR